LLLIEEAAIEIIERRSQIKEDELKTAILFLEYNNTKILDRYRPLSQICGV
jgi:RNase adaptor protein for sRNA GlmZ degradation